MPAHISKEINIKQFHKFMGSVEEVGNIIAKLPTQVNNIACVYEQELFPTNQRNQHISREHLTFLLDFYNFYEIFENIKCVVFATQIYTMKFMNSTT